MEQKRLFLLDAYALIYRAYYALIRAPRVTSKGLNTSAIFGFCNTLEEILRKENPSHIAVCFDPKGGHTFRHDAYPEYKAQRDAQPEDITLSIPYIKRIIEGYRIPIVEMPGYEADDIIGTLSRHAEKEGFDTYMMTPDKDYGQLVTDHVFMYRPALKGQGFEIRGVSQVCERYGIDDPRQVIDLLALEGDASDNIPGCPGVGEKTASKLIRQFGSVENMLEHTDEIKGALRTKVEEHAEKILFSKFLATIKTDVPVTVTPEDLVRREPDTAELRKVFEELEFRSFMSRLGDEIRNPEPVAPVADSQPSLFDFMDNPAGATSARVTEADPEITVISDLADLNGFVDDALRHDTIGVALYSVGQEAMRADWLGVGVAYYESRSVYIPVPADPSARHGVVKAVGRLFNGKSLVVSHDVKRDMVLLQREGVEFTAPYADTSVSHYLLQPEMRHSLSQVALTILGVEFNLFDDKKPYSEVAGDPAALFGPCASVTLRLHKALTPLLENSGLTGLLNDIELPFVRVLASMEMAGARIDVAELNRLSVELTGRLNAIEQEIFELAGMKFNVGSPSQVGEVLFEKLKIDPKAKRTKRGAYSTTEEILEKYAPAYPVVGLILKSRELRKLLATYINALPSLINPRTGKIHTTYNQTVTATGRISSTNPNLQNIPIRTDDGREIRRAFIADPGDLFISADYSQIELRLLANLSRDKAMINAFLSGADFHTATASLIYKEPLSEVTDRQRRNAKTANFGIIYGISAFGLSERLGISRSDAKDLIEGYFSSYPAVSLYIERSIRNARDNGFVTTIMGRRRYLPDINSRNNVVRGYAERNAVNAPIQGSAADIIKKAMIDIYREMNVRGLRSRMIMQVHDELIFNVVPDELEVMQKLITENMMNAYSGSVPLEVSVGVATNWLDAH
ncbi:MAG: DNA polymerase I [Muribaculaceae bacterium]|nr:DNA polymerase I [Muribaculaceae bacterium]